MTHTDWKGRRGRASLYADFEEKLQQIFYLPKFYEDGADLQSPRQLGLIVRHARKQSRMTQLDLASTAGVGRRFVGELEAGKPSVSLHHALLVCHALDINLMARSGREANATCKG